MMRNWPLVTQIATILITIVFLFGLALLLLIPVTLRTFFANEIYETIESSQKLFKDEQNITAIEKFQQQQDARSVNHLFIDENGKSMKKQYPRPFVEAMHQQAIQQKPDVKRYQATIEGEKMFYVIHKRQFNHQTVYQVSFMLDSYRQELVRTLYKRIIFLLFIIFIGAILLSILFARRLSKPIIQMKQQVALIANRQWNSPINVERKDEIGALAQSIEQMRVQLMNQDSTQQTMLQHVSHELKTPVMVIRSYIDAIRDKVYPKGTLEESLLTIDEEAQRLERKIKDLLYITKLDYLSKQKPQYSKIKLNDLVRSIAGYLQYKKEHIDLKLTLDEITILGDSEQWKVVVENILDNALRYAHTTIEIELNQERKYLKIWNDGRALTDEEITFIFSPFSKGMKGNFGLGLSIVKQILEMHKSHCIAKNENGGVAFYIYFQEGRLSH
ncbi:HAMP domain-containing histidine kinase [Bacillus timonensis]|nr:HAMP domain-containing histidine kinase [Bacillus timonensis]